MAVTFPASPSDGDTSVQNSITYTYSSSSNTWTAEKNFLPATGGQLSGNLTFSGSQTVDGRDVSVDGSKLDGIEVGATADQTDAEIKTAVENATNIALAGSPTTTTQSASDNSTKIATTAYVDTATSALVDSAPATLNTLNELASALGDDANYATTTANSIGLKANIASPALTGTPTAPTATSGTNTTQIATTAFVASAVTTYSAGTGMSLSGTTFNCDINSPAEVALGNLSNSGNNLSGDFTATGNITAYSDERLKENVTTIPDALSKVEAMRGVMFNKKSSEDQFAKFTKGSGVIAQELEKIAPELVLQGEYKSVAYGNLVGYLVEAIKELSAKVKKLENM